MGEIMDSMYCTNWFGFFVSFATSGVHGARSGLVFVCSGMGPFF